jgi:hypothetical protein
MSIIRISIDERAEMYRRWPNMGHSRKSRLDCPTTWGPTTIYYGKTPSPIHRASFGAPVLLEEAKAAGAKPAAKSPAPTPACDQMRAAGQWNTAWDPFVELDPWWTDHFMATGIAIYCSGLFTPTEVKLLLMRPTRTCMRRELAGRRGRDHGGAEALRGPGGAGLQSRRADPGRGIGAL